MTKKNVKICAQWESKVINLMVTSYHWIFGIDVERGGSEVTQHVLATSLNISVEYPVITA